MKFFRAQQFKETTFPYPVASFDQHTLAPVDPAVNCAQIRDATFVVNKIFLSFHSMFLHERHRAQYEPDAYGFGNQEERH